MGQAQRRKKAGTYPDKTPKPRTQARIKRNPADELVDLPIPLSMTGMFRRRSITLRNAEFMQIQKEASQNG